MTKWKLTAVMALALITGLVTACGNQPTPVGSTGTPAGETKKSTLPPQPKAVEPPEPTPVSTPLDPLAEKGKGLYNGEPGRCAGCHGLDGKPTVTFNNIPNFTDAAWHKKESDAALTKVLKEGKNLMPKYEGPESDIPALIAYVRSFGKSATPEKPKEQPKAKSTDGEPPAEKVSP